MQHITIKEWRKNTLGTLLCVKIYQKFDIKKKEQFLQQFMKNSWFNFMPSLYIHTYKENFPVVLHCQLTCLTLFRNSKVYAWRNCAKHKKFAIFFGKRKRNYFFLFLSKFGFIIKDTIWILLQNYGKIWCNIPFDNFIKYIPLISEECKHVSYFTKIKKEWFKRFLVCTIRQKKNKNFLANLHIFLRAKMLNT